MSYKFSRRDFLKYSALTAVAVAGAGLLSGCEIQDPNNPMYDINTAITLGTTKAQLTLANATEDLNNVDPDGTFKLRIYNGADAPLFVNEERFNVLVTTTDDEGKNVVVYNSGYAGNSLQITAQEVSADSYPQISPRGDVTLTIKANNFKLPEEGDYMMVFQYIPYQPQLSMRWKMTGAVESNAPSEGGDSGSTDGDITTNE